MLSVALAKRLLPAFAATKTLQSQRETLGTILSTICTRPTNDIFHPRYHEHLHLVHDRIIEPCISNSTAILADSGPNNTVTISTVGVPFHEHANMPITDFFSALGWMLSIARLDTQALTSSNIVHLLATYARICRLAGRALNDRPPTAVQMLWTSNPPRRLFWPRAEEAPPISGLPSPPSGQLLDVTSHHPHKHHPSPARISVAPSIRSTGVLLKSVVQKARFEVLDRLWKAALLDPTPEQLRHFALARSQGGVPNRSPLTGLSQGILFGHCSESITFPSLHESIANGVPLGSLAIRTRGFDRPAEHPFIEDDDFYGRLMAAKDHPDDVQHILREEDIALPMCANCQHLRDQVAPNICDVGAAILDGDVCRY
ncbi:hypothetical protein PLICRDRAFT_34017 [Plicaturopsis crispa FD-325 SS-3]|nr:hypothetical protein PLICRDRAFT_34017 [Plicaturopsis crispa FD-325 SS-3]